MARLGDWRQVGDGVQAASTQSGQGILVYGMMDDVGDWDLGYETRWGMS